MNDFISIIRTDRNREISMYKEKGYKILDEKKYRIIDTISIMQEGNEGEFNVEANEREIYFYINESGANTYFSIAELYELLEMIAVKEGETFVIEILKRQNNVEVIKDPEDQNKYLNQEAFKYKGIEYHMRKTIVSGVGGGILPDNSSKTIQYDKIFTLINLIQEKSNSLFMRGTENREYKNGLIRLFIVLLSRHENIGILNYLGWVYDESTGLHKFVGVSKPDNRQEKKYYLTEKEYSDIMQLES